MQPNQLLQLAAAAWKGPALCSFSGIYISQSAATYGKGGTTWHVMLSLAARPACQPAGGFAGSSPYPFEALRLAFRAMRVVHPGFAFVAVWEVLKAEDEFAGVPACA
ncbi:hypothetical protein [Hymenobacter terrenus]|uniref:hypothetical protein n=1 Tax=Hymenobacter terrenus TaxID=1629124 RepID=UPI000619C6F7|nr:hypothetical protein [Hymenobacter terrenus]